MFETLWYEKYRPKTLDDMVLEDGLKQHIEKWRENGEIPHLLFVGSAGIGKSSLAKIIAKEVIDCEYITINASDEGGIDTMRSKVKDFANSASLDGKIKIIILGEADGLTRQASDSLKEIVESSASSTRFIFTVNDVSRLSAPIVSRFERHYIKYSEVDFVKSCANILIKEGIDFSDNVPDLQKLLLSCYPDFRRAIGEMHKHSIDKTFQPPTESCQTFATEVWSLIEKGNPEEVRKFCIENPSKFSSHSELMIDLVKSSDRFEISKARRLILIINNFLVKDSFHSNKEINFYCCLINLTQSIN